MHHEAVRFRHILGKTDTPERSPERDSEIMNFSQSRIPLQYCSCYSRFFAQYRAAEFYHLYFDIRKKNSRTLEIERKVQFTEKLFLTKEIFFRTIENSFTYMLF